MGRPQAEMSKPKQCMSLSTLFLTVLAIYITITLLCFQSIMWPQFSIARHLLSPFHSTQPTHSHSHSHSHAAMQHPNTPPIPPTTRTLQDPPAAAVTKPIFSPPPSPPSPPVNTFTRMNDLPTSSSFTPPQPSRVCSWIDIQQRVEQLYRLHTTLIDTPALGVAVNLTLYKRCTHQYPIRVTFRVHVTGETALAAVPGVQLRENEWYTTALLRVPDAGNYTLSCRLQATNVSSDMEVRDWPYKIPLQYTDIPLQQWINRDVADSPVVNFTVPHSSYARHRPLTHTQLATTPPAQHTLPLCWTHAATPQLDGRWVLGPRHEHTYHHYASTSVFDDYAALYAPYDCAIDYTAHILPALHSLRWMHIIGDSNMRALFVRLCEAASGTMHSGDPKLGGWDLPRLCTIPRDVAGDGVLVDNATVITYTNWFYVKKLPLDPAMTFASHCTRYTEDTHQIETDGLVYGWPECAHTHPSVYQLHQPTLTYFGWGNHQAEMGGSDATRAYMRDVLFANEYWRGRHALIAYTEDVDAALLGGRWGPHFVFRNNQRVRAVNAIMRDVVEEVIDAGLWQDDETGWLPVFDAFSVTHAASEVLHGDSVHFWPELEKELVKLVAHYITHAPQLPMAQSKLQHGG